MISYNPIDYAKPQACSDSVRLSSKEWVHSTFILVYSGRYPVPFGHKNVIWNIWDVINRCFFAVISRILSSSASLYFLVKSKSGITYDIQHDLLDLLRWAMTSCKFTGTSTLSLIPSFISCISVRAQCVIHYLSEYGVAMFPLFAVPRKWKKVPDNDCNTFTFFNDPFENVMIFASLSAFIGQYPAVIDNAICGIIYISWSHACCQFTSAARWLARRASASAISRSPCISSSSFLLVSFNSDVRSSTNSVRRSRVYLQFILAFP